MSTTSALLREIESYLGESGTKATAFGLRVLNDGTFVRRLRDGAGVTAGTVDRVRAYIATQRAEMKTAKRTRRVAA
jgi:TnpA family transposase